MEANANGTRYRNYYKWDKRHNEPYNYEVDGLRSKIMSHKIWSTKNKALRYIVDYIEKSLVFCLKATDQVKQFFNYNYYNR